METNASPNEKSAQQNVADFNRTLFFGTLDALEGAKVLVWEQVLMTPFNMVMPRIIFLLKALNNNAQRSRC